MQTCLSADVEATATRVITALAKATDGVAVVVAPDVMPLSADAEAATLGLLELIDACRNDLSNGTAAYRPSGAAAQLRALAAAHAGRGEWAQDIAEALTTLAAHGLAVRAELLDGAYEADNNPAWPGGPTGILLRLRLSRRA